MTRTWDYAPIAHASRPPPTTAHRTSSSLASDPIGSPDRTAAPFPRSGSPEDDAHDKSVNLAQSAQDSIRTSTHTVRRKKSSFDLHDIFLNGGVCQSKPAPAQRSPTA
ncbi:hypothetical protein DICSQDRAFT_144745 [Dichomitus squalens LYAD-421 SS1]|uniref:uncharacterized protein n=1 Tax=Dichomitus squalens (strain LYAD-421) TaxID=732165 RepID=UPI0004410D84|nr:uncharacterized protein DICSQDRAFT_144745 [Dichomitus squalens LYAD-421 SS1]EJF64041.1 hypothetical protein DICSQDRAFT_144745 [Dichomitus squalens LYAD-421 SS1]